jgi:ribosomal protein S18 acetylase RimI-like enzyme
MRRPEIVIQSGDPSELNAVLDKRLYEFNVAATGFSDGTSLYACVQDEDGNIVAAISGHTWGGCCDVALLWVHEDHRRQGLGRALLQAAVAEAERRGCSQVTLSTHSFQAPLFYEKLGYQRVATILDYPNGHTKLYYVKRLSLKHAGE